MRKTLACNGIPYFVMLRLQRLKAHLFKIVDSTKNMIALNNATKFKLMDNNVICEVSENTCLHQGDKVIAFKRLAGIAILTIDTPKMVEIKCLPGWSALK